MLRPYVDNRRKFIDRFIELDENGAVWKDRVYASLVAEFDLVDWTVEELLSVYTNCFCAFSKAAVGVPSALKALRGRYRLGVISNGPSPFQERNLRGLRLPVTFDSIIVSAAVGLRKPDPKIFRLGCEELGVEPAEAVYVGDNPSVDIVGASSAGLQTIFIPSARYPVCDAATIVCDDISTLANCLA